ncbi:MAG: DUF86 domain-containing protein [Bacteroidaceae bacterium]|nr:DUF86 domain-containing protein [Bacteroidaceae bacterium]MBQ8221260.1 DUF86 domain-containing protein [Bacteroidaceae bacterium]MBR4042369.1 DUF86 domain-containing protein [Bacteroidaceae bacterium]
MGKKSVKKYLYDVQQSVDSIFEYLGEKRDFFEYERNKLLRRAVERELEIIGEAVKHLLELDENICIDNARRIVDLRNFVIHGYDKVDNVIIWGILSKDLPKLKQQVDALMAEQTLL